MGLIHIAGRDDPRVDDFRDLSTADRRPARPGGKGLVIAEGTVVVSRLLASRYPVRALLGVERRFAELADDLAGIDVPRYAASAETMADVDGFHLNRGILAVADRPAPLTVSEVVANAGTIAVLEGVGDHENLGALFRNAAARVRRRRVHAAAGLDPAARAAGARTRAGGAAVRRGRSRTDRNGAGGG